MNGAGKAQRRRRASRPVSGLAPRSVRGELRNPEKLEKDWPQFAFQPLDDIDLKIAQGWGDTPQLLIPDDWRTRKKK